MATKHLPSTGNQTYKYRIKNQARFSHRKTNQVGKEKQPEPHRRNLPKICGDDTQMSKTKIRKSKTKKTRSSKKSKKLTHGLKKPIRKTGKAVTGFVGLSLKLKGLSKVGGVMKGVGAGAEALGGIGG